MADKRITNLPFKTDPTLSDEMHINDVVSNFDKKILISAIRTLLSIPYMAVSISNHDNDSAPAVKQGSSFDNKGIPIDIASDLTPIGYAGISNSTTFYLYWDESAGSFIYSATVPTWTPLYQGWYNGDDRALFSMYKDSGGTLYKSKALLFTPNNIDIGGGIQTDNAILKTKIIPIGDWNMVSSASITVAHGLIHTNIRHLSAMIRKDDDDRLSPLLGNYITGGNSYLGGFLHAESVNITLGRVDSGSGGVFANTLYDSTSYNRGWITIIHEV